MSASQGNGIQLNGPGTLAIYHHYKSHQPQQQVFACPDDLKHYCCDNLLFFGNCIVPLVLGAIEITPYHPHPAYILVSDKNWGLGLFEN